MSVSPVRFCVEPWTSKEMPPKSDTDLGLGWFLFTSKSAEPSFTSLRIVAPNRHSTKAEGGNQKAPANQKQTDCCSTTDAYTDLQAGRGTPHEKDGHPVIGDTNFIRIQASTRRHLHRKLDVEPSCSSGRVVSNDQQYGW